MFIYFFQTDYYSYHSYWFKYSVLTLLWSIPLHKRILMLFLFSALQLPGNSHGKIDPSNSFWKTQRSDFIMWPWTICTMGTAKKANYCLMTIIQHNSVTRRGWIQHPSQMLTMGSAQIPLLGVFVAAGKTSFVLTHAILLPPDLPWRVYPCTSLSIEWA